ncbi:hypothetical protein GCM10022267_83700 [Lentzea roselyniae]|uniref:Uncharacterized protein n=1 Tax=Lentzea roselyniae TaxID=531940 RepID=A0ABP7CCJ0_9PSEU
MIVSSTGATVVRTLWHDTSFVEELCPSPGRPVTQSLYWLLVVLVTDLTVAMMEGENVDLNEPLQLALTPAAEAGVINTVIEPVTSAAAQATMVNRRRFMTVPFSSD